MLVIFLFDFFFFWVIFLVDRESIKARPSQKDKFGNTWEARMMHQWWNPHGLSS
jgi:hypothetical protein